MPARIRGFRTVARLHTFLTLAAMASAFGPQRDALAQSGQQGWSGRPLRSVVVRQNVPTPVEGELVVPGGQSFEAVQPRVVEDGRFDAPTDSRGVVVEGPYPNGTIVEGPSTYGSPRLEHDPGSVPHAYGAHDEGFVSDGGPHDAEGGILVDDTYPPCGAPDCVHGCRHCMVGHGGYFGDGHGRPWFNAFCEPVGLTQRLAGLLHGHCKDTCWTGRGDALILWRNAPQIRPLYTTNPEVVGATLVALDASQLESPAAGGGRLQLFRHDPCGDILEFGYLYGGNFFSEQVRPNFPGAYLTAPPGLDGVDFPEALRALDQVGAQLLGSIQSAEINRRVGLHESMQFLYGFRWFQWYERSLIVDSFGEVEDPPTLGADIYSTSTINNLWGGQIGLDTLLLRTKHGYRLEGIVKAGVYANNAGQTSRYIQLDEGGGFASQVTDNLWPASASFVGEVGMTGVVPISECWDFRFGYLGLWLTGLAQPTNQLSSTNIAQGVERPTAVLNTVGTVIVQGVTLGLEGRW